jgi:hypothetical protein
MELVDDTMTCVVGDMQLSEVMANELAAIAANPPSPSEPSTVLGNGRWYCPADGALMTKLHDRVECPRYSRFLTRAVLYQLIEVHVHR